MLYNGDDVGKYPLYGKLRPNTVPAADAKWHQSATELLILILLVKFTQYKS